MTKTNGKKGCHCKVGTLIREYNLDDTNDELANRWTGRLGEPESVRSLADWFNRQLLREEMRSGNLELIEGRVENLYNLLTDDAALEAVRIQARSVLSEGGVDIEQLEEKFVSHQSIYRHLRNCLEVEKEINTLSIEKEQNRVNSLQNRAEAVITDSVSRLRDESKLSLDNFEVLVNFRVTCESCGTLHDASTLLAEGGCSCQTTLHD
ncbi:hypothetical protein DMJ13_21225 [halophilic archaeon]|nr:hypothetical protein DMJ13_21225 [halophilic archaeon]